MALFASLGTLQLVFSFFKENLRKIFGLERNGCGLRMGVVARNWDGRLNREVGFLENP